MRYLLLIVFITGLGIAPGPSSADDFSATLSWSVERVESDATPDATGELYLYILLDGISNPTSLKYDIHYSAPEHAGACVHIRGCPPGESIGPCFKPTVRDSSRGGNLLFGTSGLGSGSAADYAVVPLQLDDSCGPFPMRFFLGRVVAVDGNGETKRCWSASEVTILGGTDLSLQPVLQNATRLDHESEPGGIRIWAVAANADSSTSFGLWQRGQPLATPRSVEHFPPHHFLLTFGEGEGPGPTYLVAGDRLGRVARFLVPVQGVDANDEPSIYLVSDSDPTAHFESINDALSVARDGDTVLVGPGRYEERIVLNNNVSIRSVAGPDQTILDGLYEGRTFTVLPGLQAPAALEGFTITGGGKPPSLKAFEEHVGGGLHIGVGSSIVVQGNRVEGNNAFVRPSQFITHGGGIGSLGASLISSNTVQDNGPASSGGGIYCGSGSSDLILSNVLKRNESLSVGGGVAVADQAASTLRDNRLVSNRAYQHGGGISIASGATSALSLNHFELNEAGYLHSCDSHTGRDAAGGGLYVDSDARIESGIDENTFEFNRACVGGGACIRGSTMSIVGNQFLDNEAELSGGGLYVDGGAGGSFRIQDNSFWNNRVKAAEGAERPDVTGGGLTILAESASVVNNSFVGNQAEPDSAGIGTTSGGACYLKVSNGTDLQAAVEFKNNDLVENRAAFGSVIWMDGNLPGLRELSVRNNIIAWAREGRPFGIEGGFGSAWAELNASCNVFWMNDAEVPPEYVGTCTWFLDPRFCNPEEGDYRIDFGSICNEPNQPRGCPCGPIGSEGVGCDRGIGIEGAVDVGPIQYMRLLPNPAIRSARIALVLSEMTHDLTVSIYDASGRQIAVIEESDLEPGSHVLDWDGTDSQGVRRGPGLYFLRVVADGHGIGQKLVLLR